MNFKVSQKAHFFVSLEITFEMKSTVIKSKLSKNAQHKIKVYLLFVLATTIVWFLMRLSKNYTSTVKFNVNYINLPKERVIQNQPISTLDIEVYAPGFSLLRYNLFRHKIPIDLSKISKIKGNYYIFPNQQLASISSKFSQDTKFIKVLNDSILVELGINKIKKVPIISAIDINFKLGYNLTENLKINPDSITVIGPEKYIDTIKNIKTKYLKLSDIYQNINASVDLKLPKNNSQITYSTKLVNISGRVDKFTEGKLTLPVSIINLPYKVKLITFPKQIEVIYKVGLSNFNSINKNSFSIVFDYKEYENDTLIKYLTPIIEQKSDLVSSVRIIPDKIEFLIEKQ